MTMLYPAFTEAVKKWHAAEAEALRLRMDYEHAYSRALIEANGKSAEVRKAQADIAALDELHNYQAAAIDAQAARMFCEFLTRHGEFIASQAA
jgi:hypothetical protein